LNIYRQFILEKMLRHGFVGGKHTNIQNIPKGRPKGEYNSIQAEIDVMRKEGYFIIRPKGDGLHISLNPRKMDEIAQELNILNE